MSLSKLLRDASLAVERLPNTRNCNPKHLSVRLFAAADDNEWVPVQKALPSVGRTVLVYGNGDMYICQRNKLYGGLAWYWQTNIGGVHFSCDNFTHWRPRPDTPSSTSKENMK